MGFVFLRNWLLSGLWAEAITAGEQMELQWGCGTSKCSCGIFVIRQKKVCTYNKSKLSRNPTEAAFNDDE